MKTKEKWLIDTNVVVHWLMAEQIMQFLVAEFKLAQQFHDTYANRYGHSVDFIVKVLEVNKREGEFSVAELSLNELFSAIRDEIRTVMLFVRGVPLSRWASKRETQEVRFSEDLLKNVHELTLQGFDQLFGEKHIAITPTIAPSDEDDYLELYSSLVFLNPEMKTQDAILVAHAIFDGVSNFVTTDQTLVQLGKELKERYGLAVVSPHKALELLRSQK